MTTHPSHESLPINYPDGPAIGNQLRETSEIILRFADLIESLPTHAPASRQSVEYEFFPRNDLEESYPELIKDRLLTRDLQIIRITSVMEADIPEDIESGNEAQVCSPTTTIEFEDEDGTIYISRDPDMQDSITPDTLIDHKTGKLTSIGRVPDDEISEFLLRLASKPVNELLSEEDAFKMRIEASDVIGKLHENAIAASFDYAFETPSGRTLTLSFEQADNYMQLNKFTIYYETGSNREISVEIDPKNRFSLHFQTNDSDSSLFIADDGDYLRLYEILGEELVWVNGLSQDSLDAPDPSA